MNPRINPQVLKSVEVLHKNAFDSSSRITMQQYIDIGDKVVVVEFWSRPSGEIYHISQRDLRAGETF
jgi:hypothetical protein